MSISKVKFNENNEAVVFVDSLNQIDQDTLKAYMNFDHPLFLKCKFEEGDLPGLYYSLEDYRPLKEYLSQTMTKANAIGLLKSLVQAFVEAEKNGLNPKQIVLGINHIFVRTEKFDVACIYVPVIDGCFVERPLRLFIKELLVNMMYSDEDDMRWLGELIRFINRNRQLDADTLYAYLCSFDTDVVSVEEEALDMMLIIIEETDEDDQTEAPEGGETEAASVVGCLYRRSNQLVYELQNEITRVGKASDNEICIQNNPVISRVHAVITRHANGYTVRDNGSTNHTFVNGLILKPEQEKVLSENDRIVLGNEEFVFKMK